MEALLGPLGFPQGDKCAAFIAFQNSRSPRAPCIRLKLSRTPRGCKPATKDEQSVFWSFCSFRAQPAFALQTSGTQSNTWRREPRRKDVGCGASKRMTKTQGRREPRETRPA